MEQKFLSTVFSFLVHYILNNTKDGRKSFHVLTKQVQCTNLLHVLKTTQNKLSEAGCRQNRALGDPAEVQNVVNISVLAGKKQTKVKSCFRLHHRKM